MIEAGRPKVAFVVQRCGEDIAGGAEALCVRIARQLAPVAEVEILTTCARDYTTWRNAYAPGPARVHGVRVQRFAVDAERDPRRFATLSRRLRDRLGATTRADEEQWMQAQGPVSSALRAYVAERAADYQQFGFFSYLYATSYLLLPIVAPKAVLWPFAHDEWPLRLGIWDAFFGLPRRLAYISPEEQTLIERRFPGCSPGSVMPVGVEPPGEFHPDRFRADMRLVEEPFMLYLGRIDPDKGCAELFDFFLRYRARGGRIRTLVALGEKHMAVPSDPAIVAPGRVDDATKWDALAAADVVVMPSPYESLSLAVLEAWTAGTPVLVNGATHVLVAQCRRAGGGLWYSTYDEFEAALEMLEPDLRQRLGAQGQRFVTRHYAPGQALKAYTEMVANAI